MTHHSESPGLLTIKKKTGKTYHYWRADRAATDNPKVKEYPDQSVNISRLSEEERQEKCKELTAKLQSWLTQGAPDPLRFDGTIGSLARIYEKHEHSPFQSVSPATQTTYLTEANNLIRAVGKRRLDKVTGTDVLRWHEKASAPAKPGGKPQLRRAQGLIRHLRRIVSFGVMERLPGCSEFRDILSELRIKAPEPRKTAPSFNHIQEFIEAAHKQGRPSMALAQTIMFELTMRQTDVIGQWVKTDDTTSGITDHGKRWISGLVWQDIKEGVLVKKTSKTGAIGRWVISEYPLLMQELDKVPLEKRFGPIIIDEHANRPYFHRHFARLYREIANSAGIPEDIWSRDYRAGGITEALDAGANIEQTRQHATHTDIKMTGRYNRGSEKQTAEVAKARARLRSKNQSQNKP